MIAIFLFYSKGFGKPSKYSFGKIKHCNVICYDGDNYILFTSTENGIGHRVIRQDCGVRIIRNLKRLEDIVNIIAIKIEEPADMPWFPLWIRTCNEIARSFTGIDVGLTINPSHLLKKLLKYDGKRNYSILHKWSADNEF